MSADILAAPHLNVNVRYTRKVQQNRREEEENHGEILEDEEHRADVGSQTARAHAEKKPATRRCFIAAAVAVGGMYLLMFAGIFLRYIAAVSDKDQLQRSYDSLHNNHSQLQQEVKLLHRQISGLCCPEGWTRFGCSCYYKVSQRKKWEDSRTDCQSRAADLVVINSREEQEFVRGLNEPGAFWIGLKAEYTHKTTGWEPNWEWVDGSALTLRFWEPGHSQKTWFHYAECCNKQGKWTQSRYFNSNNWICEKTMSCLLC